MRFKVDGRVKPNKTRGSGWGGLPTHLCKGPRIKTEMTLKRTAMSQELKSL